MPPLSTDTVRYIYLALLGGPEQTALLRQAWAQGLADGRLVFLPYDTMLFSLPCCILSYPTLGHIRPPHEVCDTVLTISLGPAPRIRPSELPW